MKFISKVCVFVTVALVLFKFLGITDADWWLMFSPMYGLGVLGLFFFAFIGISFCADPTAVYTRWLINMRKDVGDKKGDLHDEEHV